jgi:calcium/calmodulin-dependent protein kinase I
MEHPWISGKVKLPTLNLSKSVSMNLKKSGLSHSKTQVDQE